VVAQEALKFGPPIGSSRNSQYSLNRDQLTQASTQVKPQPPPRQPPPVYTRSDPLQANYNASLNSKSYQNIEQGTATVSKTGYQISNETIIDSKNKQTIASEIGNAANINKPANQQHLSQTTSDHLKHQNTNKSKAPQVSRQVQSPSYDPLTNRHVWTNDSSKSTIDFDKDSQKVKNDVLTGNDVAMAISNELNKNKSLSEVRKLLVNNEYLSDIRFILNSIVFHGHKLFLVTASPLFYQHFQINGLKEMKVDGIDEGIFLAMLSFCYTGILHKLTDDNILSTLLVADKLKISQAYTTCCGFITTKINPDGVFVVFEKAIDLESEQFQKKCLDYIKKNEAKCFSSKGFFKISLPSLVTMLEKCDYPSEKLNEVVEKWNHGPAIPEAKATNNPPVTQTKVEKKKGNPQNQQQQVQRNQQQNAQQQQKHKNPKGHQNQQQQRNQPNMQHFQQQNMIHMQQQNMHHIQQQNLHHFQQQNMHHIQQQVMQNYQLQQQRNQQQQQLKNPKQNEGQKTKNRQQQNRKPGPGNQQIPNLIDLDIPPPPFAEGFQGNAPIFAAGSSMRHADSISNLSDDLMSFGGDDDDRTDDLNGLVCVDDDEGGRVKVVIKGTESVGMTEFARIDFIAKRSFFLHEVWFNENMIQNSNEIRISIAVFEGEHRSDIHSRSIKGVSSKSIYFAHYIIQTQTFSCQF